MRSTHRLVLAATGYPLHGHAFQSYLKGHYQVELCHPTPWADGLALLERQLARLHPMALIVDDTFPYSVQPVAQLVNAHLPTCGLLYVDAHPNIFKVLHGLEVGYRAYLFMGDPLAEQLPHALDMTRRGERCLSPTILGLYERYTLYKGLFTEMPRALYATFKLMGEGLTIRQIVDRTGLRPEVVYRRQYRLRQYFGVGSNEDLVQVLEAMFE